MARAVITLASLDIPTAGTRVQVSATATPVSTVIFQANAANTNGVWIGDSAVAANRGLELAPGQSFIVSADALGTMGEEFILSDFYVDTDTNGNDVSVSYVKRR